MAWVIHQTPPQVQEQEMEVEAARAHGNSVHLTESRHFIPVVWNSQAMDNHSAWYSNKSLSEKGRKSRGNKSSKPPEHRSVYPAKRKTWCLRHHRLTVLPGTWGLREGDPCCILLGKIISINLTVCQQDLNLGPSLLKPRSPEITLMTAAVCH